MPRAICLGMNAELFNFLIDWVTQMMTIRGLTHLDYICSLSNDRAYYINKITDFSCCGIQLCYRVNFDKSKNTGIIF